MAFDFHGTKGAVCWNYERMNELKVFLPDGTPAHDGTVLIQAGEAHPTYAAFYPGRANAMGYEDLKAIESLRFLESVARNEQGEPGFAQELQVAAVQEAMARSLQRAVGDGRAARGAMNWAIHRSSHATDEPPASRRSPDKAGGSKT